MMLTINPTINNNRYHLTVAGDVDASSSIQLDTAMQTAVKSGQKVILVDASELSYISSAGLGVFMSYIEELEAQQIQLIIYGLNYKVRNVFQILGLDQLLKLADSEQEAIKQAQDDLSV